MADDAGAVVEIEAFLADWLGRDSELTVLHQGRIHPVFLPDDVDLTQLDFVAFTYRRQGTTRPMHLAGSTGNAKATFEIRIWGHSDKRAYANICRAARIARLKLDGLQTETPDGHFVERAAVTNEYDDEELPIIDDGVLGLCRVLTVEIDYLEQSRSAMGGA